MTEIENINKIINESQETSCKYNEYLKMMITKGETFLKKFSKDEKLPQNVYSIKDKISENDLFKLRIRVYEDFEEHYYLVLKSQLFPKKYSCYISKETAPSEINCIIAYAIAIILFDKLPSSKLNFTLFEFPNNFSTYFNPVELSFIYSLILPYQKYKEHLTEFIKVNYEHYKNGNFENNQEWIYWLSCVATCPQSVATVISTFYSTLYFEELHKIWTDYINSRDQFNQDNNNSEHTKSHIPQK